ncbi:MAG: hypothetical protein KGR16_07600 [Verrucomicrobia bacterium]|nr:hypothetical protein [Verrucomicrobiota bacterium]MDE3047189.1 hypothetical protein [Verrucomicrobiota bacterium]
MMRRILLLLALVLVCVEVGQGLHALKSGFSSRRIQSLSNPASEEWSEEADQALQQTFRYLGRGRQCFAFTSEDGKYVLKFPRTDIYKTPFWAKALPVRAYREKLEAEHKIREQFILTSFQIAFQELKEQTALLAIHLGQSSSNRFLTVIDSAGCKHRLPLGATSFVLQHKHPLLMKAFSEALTRGDEHEAKNILNALFAVIDERASLGILNRDRSFLKNYGYDGTRAYQIDVGSFFKSADLPFERAREKSIRDSTDPVDEWLTQNAPEMLPDLHTFLFKKL